MRKLLLASVMLIVMAFVAVAAPALACPDCRDGPTVAALDYDATVVVMIAAQTTLYKNVDQGPKSAGNTVADIFVAIVPCSPEVLQPGSGISNEPNGDGNQNYAIRKYGDPGKGNRNLNLHHWIMA